MAIQTITVKIALSPLQWGERPGSLRFSIYANSDLISIGSFSIGGLSAYQLREKISNASFLSARVIHGGPRKFVLTHILCDDGWLPWKQAVAITSTQSVEVLVDNVAIPLERRTASNRTERVEA